MWNKKWEDEPQRPLNTLPTPGLLGPGKQSC